VDQLNITHQRRFNAEDADLAKIAMRWQGALRQAVARLPNIRFPSAPQKPEESIQLVETPGGETTS